MMKKAIALFVASLGMVTVAHADILAAGSLQGGDSQYYAVCYLFNAGTAAVNITGKGMYPQNSTTALAITNSNCGATLAPNATCAFVVLTAAGGMGTSCKVVVGPSGSDVRGALEIRSAANVVLNSVPLR